MEVEERIATLMLNNSWTLSLAESCTGGQIADRLTNMKNSGKFVVASDVVYCNEAKKIMLGVPKDLLDACGPYNRETARQMALGSRVRTNSTIALAITGLAGKHADEHGVEAGTAYIGISTEEFGESTTKITLDPTICKIKKKQMFTTRALETLELWLEALLMIKDVNNEDTTRETNSLQIL